MSEDLLAMAYQEEIHHCIPSLHNRCAAWGKFEEVAIGLRPLQFAPRNYILWVHPMRTEWWLLTMESG